MSRGSFEHRGGPEAQVWPVTGMEIERARQDYRRWVRERHDQNIPASLTGKLFNQIRRENTDFAEWLEALCLEQHGVDEHETEIFMAATAIMYDLLRRKSVAAIMDQGFLSPLDAARALPKPSLPKPQKIGGNYLAIAQHIAASGEREMGNKQNTDVILGAVWALLPSVIDFDPEGFNPETVGRLKSIARWATMVVYGALHYKPE